jgi:beta-glucosidase
MASYNRLNGLHASEDPHLLRDILRGDFKFNGMVMSDWGGTYSATESITAGLDLEMPGPSMMRLTNVEREVVSGKLALDAIDKCVLNVGRKHFDFSSPDDLGAWFRP